MDATSPFSLYWRGLKGPERLAYATRAGTTVNHCNGLAYDPVRKAGPKLAIRMAAASEGALTVEQVCPGYPWHLVQQAA